MFFAEKVITLQPKYKIDIKLWLQDLDLRW